MTECRDGIAVSILYRPSRDLDSMPSCLWLFLFFCDSLFQDLVCFKCVFVQCSNETNLNWNKLKRNISFIFYKIITVFNELVHTCSHMLTIVRMQANLVPDYHHFTCILSVVKCTYRVLFRKTLSIKYLFL